jgi:HemY protein
MMSVLKWFLALALTVPVAMLGYLLAKDAGRLSIRAWGWQIDTTLVLALALMVLLVTAILFAHWLLWRLPMRVIKRRQALLHAQFSHGIEDYLLGRFQKAKRRLISASAIPEHAPLALFYAAKAADAMDDSKEALTLSEKAARFESVKLAAEPLNLDLRIRSGDLSAIASLESLAPNNPIAAKILARQLGERGRAQEAMSAIQQSGASAKRKDVEWAAMVRLAIAQAPTLSTLEQTWQRLSQAEREQVDVLSAYTQRLAHFNATVTALELLQPALKKQNSDLLWQSLAKLAPSLSEDQAREALRVCESQLDRNAPQELPNNLLAGAILCQRLQLFGKAKQYLERSLACEESSAARSVEGEIKLAEGDHLSAARSFQRALELER